MTDKQTIKIVNLLLERENLKSADAISKAIPLAKGKILFSFFKSLEAAIKSELDFVSVETNSFKDLQYDVKKCENWFRIDRKKSYHHVGVFFNIGIPNLLFRIEVASQALHYGVVPVKEVDIGKYENTNLQNLPVQTTRDFERRTWISIKWFSVLYKDFVSSELDCIRDNKEFVAEVVSTIREIKGISDI